MRVVAGKYRGHTLRAPRGDATRPTADKVREAIFSILGAIEDMRVLDLFAGTGALGIEALSRGASHATLVEMDPAALRVLQGNVDAIVRPDQHDNLNPIRVLRGDVHDHLRRFAATSERFNLVFVDPPYDAAGEHAPALGAALPAVLTEGAVVVVECDRRQPLMLERFAQEVVPRVDERRYGDTLIRILRF